MLLLGDSSHNKKLFSNISPGSRVKIISTLPEINNTEADYIYATAAGQVIFMIGDRKISFNLNDPDKIPDGITGFQIIEAAHEGLIIDEGVDIKTEDMIQDLPIWSKSYPRQEKVEAIQTLLLERLSENERILTSNISNSLKKAEQFQRLVEASMKIDLSGNILPEPNIKTNEYRPMYESVLKGFFRNSLIYPIVYDQKHYFTEDSRLLNPSSEDKTYPDFVFLDDNEFMDVMKKLSQLSYYASKNKNPKIMNYKLLQDYLERGGTINITTEDGQESHQLVSVRRPFNNDSKPDSFAYYELQIQDSVFVYRHALPVEGQSIIGNPATETSPIYVEKRLAAGELNVFQDRYSEKLISDVKGKYGKIKVCVGTSGQEGSESYYTGDKTSELNNIMLGPPESVKISDGESVNVIGYLVLGDKHYDYAMSFPHSQIINDSVVQPKGFVDGWNLADLITRVQEKTKNPKQWIDDIIENSEIIENADGLDIGTLPLDRNYFILMDYGHYQKFDKTQYENYLKKIIPTVSQIYRRERDSIVKANNFEELQAIFNKHGMRLDDLNADMMKTLKIKNNLVARINNSIMIRNQMNKKLKNVRVMMKQYKMLYESIMAAKTDLEKTIMSKLDDNKFNILRSALSNRIKTLLEGMPLSDIERFIIEYMGILPSDIQDVSGYAYLIANVFLSTYPVIQKTNILIQYFIDNLQNLPDKYDRLIRDYFKYNNITLFDSDFLHNKKDYRDIILIDLMNMLDKTRDNGAVFYYLIELLNHEKYVEHLRTILEDFAKEEFAKENPGGSWEKLEEFEKDKYRPNEKNLRVLFDQVKELKEKYDKERKKYNFYLEECNNLKIVKKYTNLVRLLQDNGREIYYDTEYDTTSSDMNLYSKIEHKYEEKDREKPLKDELKTHYLFDSEEEIQAKYDSLKEAIKNSVFRRKVRSGEKCLLITETGKYIYKRVDNTWVEMSHADIQSTQQCYNGNMDVLGFSIQELMENISKVEKGSNIIFFLKEYVMLRNQMDAIGKLIKFVQETDSFQKDRIQSIEKELEILKNLDDKKQNRFVLKTETVKTETKPPTRLSEIRDVAFNVLNDDVDMGLTLMKDLLSKYGSPRQMGGKKIENDWFYWNIYDVEEPMMCKHYGDLIPMAWRNNQDRTKILESVLRRWGVKQGEKYICHNCGQFIEFIEFSNMEGFRGGDRVIKYREEVKEDDEIVDDEGVLTPGEEIVKNKLDLFLSALGVHMKFLDVKRIINDAIAMNSSLPNIHRFYYEFIKNYDNPKLQDNLKKPEFVMAENNYRQEFGDITIDKIDSILSLDPASDIYRRVFPFIRVFRVKDKSGPIKDTLFRNLHSAYLNHKRIMNILSGLCAVLKTAIPDYYIHGTGIERKVGGTSVGDFYGKTEEGIKRLVDIYRKYAKENSSDKGFWQVIQNYYFEFLQKTETEIRNELNQEYNNVLANIYYSEQLKKKDIYRIEQDLLILGRGDLDYYWAEFRPQLKIDLDFSYDIPDISGLVSEYKELVVSKKNSERLITLETNLKDIAGQITNYLMVLINRVISKETLERYNPSAYIAYCCYNSIRNRYLDYLIEKEPEIQTVKKLIDQLNDAFTNFKAKEEVVLVNLKPNMRDRKILSDMYFNPALYKNDESLIKKSLKEKLKQVYLMVVTDGELKGQKRVFKDIYDPDFFLLAKVYHEDPNSSRADRVKRLHELLMERYPGRTPDYIRHKIGIIENAINRPVIDESKVKKDEKDIDIITNVLDEIDITTNEYKSDIIDKFAKEVNSLSVKEMEKKLLDFYRLNNLANTLYLNPYATVLDIDVLDIYDAGMKDFQVLISKLEEFNSEWKEINLFEKVNEIHNSLKASIRNRGYLTDEDRLSYKRQMSDLFGFMTESIDYNIKAISGLIGKTGVNVVRVLENLYDFEYIQNEFERTLEEELTKENITDKKKRKVEERFRKRFIKETYKGIQMNELKSLFYWIVQTINMIHNRVLFNPTNMYRNNFVDTDKIKLTEILEPYRNKIDAIILKCFERNEVLYGGLDLEPLVEIVDKISTFNDGIDGEGQYKWSSFFNAEYLGLIVKMLIVYLIRFMIESVYEDEEEIRRLVKDYIRLLMDEIKKQEEINDMDDRKIRIILDNHRAEENSRRKDRFARMSKDEQLTQKLYRKFGLGRVFQATDDLEIDFSELEEVYQSDGVKEGVYEETEDGGMVDEEKELKMGRGGAQEFDDEWDDDEGVDDYNF